MSDVSKKQGVCLCVNSGMYLGFLVTFSSLLRNVSDPEIDLIVYHADLTAPQLARIKNIMSVVGKPNRLIFMPADLARYSRIRGLQGDHMTYQRLSIAEDFKEYGRILYLDSDLLLNDISIDSLLDLDLEGLSTAAGSVGPADNSLEWSFFAECGLAEDELVFNAGVLLIDVAAWVRGDLLERSIEFGERHSAMLPSADQTILNVLLRGAFIPLEEKFNYTNFYKLADGSMQLPSAIIHFVGSPKPWDIFGAISHPLAGFWKTELNSIGISWSQMVLENLGSVIARERHIYRSSVRSLWRWIRS